MIKSLILASWLFILASPLAVAQEIRSVSDDARYPNGYSGYHAISSDDNSLSWVSALPNISQAGLGHAAAVDSFGNWMSVSQGGSWPNVGISTSWFDNLAGYFSIVNSEAKFPMNIESFLNGAAFDDNDRLHILFSNSYGIDWLFGGTSYVWSVDTTSNTVDTSPVPEFRLGIHLPWWQTVRGLEFHDGYFYSMGSPGGLLKIDPSTGDTQVLFPNQYIRSLTQFHRWYKGVCVSDSGVFYTVAWEYRYVPPPADYFEPINSELCIIDLETGVYSPINEYDLPETEYNMWAIEFIEGAVPAQALWQSGTSDAGGFAPMTLKGNGVGAGDQVALYFTTDLTARDSIIPAGLPGAGLRLDIGGRVKYIGTATANIDGEYELGPQSVPGRFADKLLIQGINLNNQKVTNFFRVTE
ncbi:MAG: hypothetical protein H8E25_02740 [Planctomycetes bacterium]|nr:hypothetical protein [Planctomycetota bacterium]